MIRLAVMMDKNRVIGSFSKEVNDSHFATLPECFRQTMVQLYKGENIAGGTSSWNFPTSQARQNRYVISHQLSFDTEGESVRVCTDAMALVHKYQHSDEELLIVGGLSIFNFFTPYAHVFDIAVANELLLGDLVYDCWEKESLKLQQSSHQKGFCVERYVR